MLSCGHIGDWGKEALADPNREIGFGFVSCSCRACVRAKLRERVRDVLPQRWRLGWQEVLRLRRGFGFSVFAAISIGFKAFS